MPLILLIDDDAILLESMADLLMLSDFQVLTAQNGVEALTVLEEHQPDCIVTDVMMPEMNGFEFINEVRKSESLAEIPIVLVTAYDRASYDRMQLDSPPNAVLSKPFDVDELVEAIQEQLR